jgi:hypothetical protein
VISARMVRIIRVICRGALASMASDHALERPAPRETVINLAMAKFREGTSR